MKILCSADWHLDAPMAAGDDLLRAHLLAVPEKLAALCRQERCDLVLLSGDLFDGPYTAESLNVLRSALSEMAVPVFIAPGNHDYVGNFSPWTQESFPDNVHIFTQPHMCAVPVPSLGLTVYGAGYTGMDCDPLLEGFRAEEGLCVGVLHGDPTVATSPYCPITRNQVAHSGLKLLALGHIHKGGSFTAGDALCVWPGCPMGRGYDEPGEKGALIVTLEDTVSCRFVPLDTPRFYDLTVEAGDDVHASLSALLPAAHSDDYYRITLTGPSTPLDLAALNAAFSHLSHLTLRDRTTPPLDIWGAAGEDTFEGTYFGLLRDALEQANDTDKQTLLLAAKISRQLLNGQEVSLP